jgi:polar amino acid transport system permease protein
VEDIWGDSNVLNDARRGHQDRNGTLSYDLDFSWVGSFTGAFAQGALLTILISLASFVVGTIIGLVIAGLLLVSPFKSVTLLINDALRALPPLVLIFFFYFFPYEQFLNAPPLGAISATIAGLAFSQAVYTGDLTYQAVRNVSPRLAEAGRALGVNERNIWLSLILPDVARQTAAAQMAFFIGIVRLSSLGAVIGAYEVVYVARVSIAQTFRSLEAWLVVGAIYILLVTPFTFAARLFEQSPWLKRRF